MAPPKNVAVTGATGFIGSRLCAALRARGDVATLLGRDFDAWLAAIDGSDAVVHLAGEPAVGKRWSEAVKQRIRDSRVVTTERIVEAIGAARVKPRVVVCASAVGYYGSVDGATTLDESSPPGDDFLARLCVEWEAAARRAADHGARVVSARFGIMLGRGGGALQEMAMPFRMFAGGPIGDGRQVISWMHVDDCVGALLLLLDGDLSGAVNLVAPEAATSAELAKAIGVALQRPSWLSAPAFALKLRFGEGAGPLLGGQRVRPGVLEASGFQWRYPTLSAALAEALG